jgi:hypothetical protein
MSKNIPETHFPRSLRWQNVDKFLKQFLHRTVTETTPFDTVIDEYGNEVKQVFSRHKFICWYSRLFEINEFYHTYGTPSIWFHGYLPKSEFGEPEFNSHEPDYGYYDFEIRNLEHFKEVLVAMNQANNFFSQKNTNK